MSLSNNSLGRIRKNDLEQFTRLEEIHLDHNDINRIDDIGLGSNHTYLMFLDLSNNNIKNIDNLLCEKFQNLKTFNMSNNHLTFFSFDGILNKWPNIELIKINDNLIEMIDPHEPYNSSIFSNKLSEGELYQLKRLE